MGETVAIMFYIIHIPLGFNWVFLGRNVVLILFWLNYDVFLDTFPNRDITGKGLFHLRGLRKNSLQL